MDDDDLDRRLNEDAERWNALPRAGSDLDAMVGAAARRRRVPAWALVAAAAVVVAAAVSIPVLAHRGGGGTAAAPSPMPSTAAGPATAISSTGPAGPASSVAGSTTARSSEGAAPTCPKVGGGVSGVPQRPTGVPTDRLVPDTAPTSALLCAYYRGSDEQPGATMLLSDQTQLDGNLAAITDDLAWLPPELPNQQKPCTAMGGPQTDYLLALTYPDGGLVWVSGAQDPNSCVGTSNGAFSSLDNTGRWFADAMKAGRWLPHTAPDRSPCDAGGSRFGQQTDMVPAGVSSVEICRTRVGSPAVTGATLDAGFDTLVATLNAEPTTASTRMCQMTGKPGKDGGKPEMGPMYRIVARYPTGPAVSITVQSGCDPAIDNSSLQATDGGAVIPVLESILDQSGTTTTPTG